MNEVQGIKQWTEKEKNKVSKTFYSFSSIEDFLENFVEMIYGKSIYSHYYNYVNINNFDLVGVTNRMDESLDLIYFIFGVKIKNLFVNINPNHQVGQPYNFGYSRKDFYKKYSQDYDIYINGIEMFNNLSQKHLYG